VSLFRRLFPKKKERSSERVKKTESNPLNGTGKITESYRVIRCEKGGCRTGSHELIGEELFHAAGFCLGEGIADSPDDFLTIGYCEDPDPNVIDVRLKPEGREKIHDLLERRGFVSQTSCGICGKEMVKDLYQILTPAENGFRIEINRIFECIRKLSENQKYYQTTRGSHAAILFDNRLQMISFAEDVGRHSALDKAIGKVFIGGKLPEAAVLILSSRISYELVQKAARAHLSIMISKSRPTILAAEMEQALNMTLARTGKESELICVCGENRIVV
jgi:FdhD protein